MKNKVYILFLLLILSEMTAVPCAYGAGNSEYQIKAAYIYNFIKFIDWSDESMPADSNSITIGIVGGDDLIKDFNPIKSKQVKGRNIVIKQFDEIKKPNKLLKKNAFMWKEKISALKKCQVLFISIFEDEKPEIPVEILKAMKASGVLVIGEIPGFLENGGIINFIMENKKVRFEINAEAAEHNGLKISAQLLKLSKRISTKK
jgi:hypothetical protein